MTDQELWEYAKQFARRQTGTFLCTPDDLAVEIWLKFHKRLPQYDPKGGMSIRTWLYQEAAWAVGQAYEHTAGSGRQLSYRRGQRFELPVELDEETVGRFDGFEDFESRWLLAGLSDKQQRYFLLRRDGFDSGEVADMLGIPHGSVEYLTKTARKRVRANMKEEGLCVSKRSVGP